jgi:multidrug efflux pump subunit AcrA (membrane-fusion protein)
MLIEPGELVTPQQKLAVLGSAKDFEMELQVDEFDIARIRVGQVVQVTLDSYRGEVFQGSVSRVDPSMDSRSRTFTVMALFTTMPEMLYPNLTVEANIVVDRKDQAMTIPAEYLVDGGFVLTGKDERIAVEIGLRDLQRVEVISGIDSSTVILKP